MDWVGAWAQLDLPLGMLGMGMFKGIVQVLILTKGHVHIDLNLSVYSNM